MEPPPDSLSSLLGALVLVVDLIDFALLAPLMLGVRNYMLGSLGKLSEPIRLLI